MGELQHGRLRIVDVTNAGLLYYCVTSYATICSKCHLSRDCWTAVGCLGSANGTRIDWRSGIGGYFAPTIAERSVYTWLLWASTQHFIKTFLLLY